MTRRSLAASTVDAIDRRPGVWVAVLVLTGLALRMGCIGRFDLTLDEAFSFFLVRDHSIGEILYPFTDILYNDAHPPLHYAVCRIWHVTGFPLVKAATGNIDFAFRLPHAVMSALVSLVLFQLGKAVCNHRLGLLLALLHAFNSYSVQMAHQSRMYPQVELLGALALIAYSRLSPRAERGPLALLAACSSLMLLTHYLCVFFIGALWIGVVIKARGTLHRLIVPIMAAVAGFAWWLPALAAQLQREVGQSVQSGSAGGILPYTLFQFVSGDRSLPYGSLPASSAQWAVIASCAAAALLLAGDLIRSADTRGKSGPFLLIAIGSLIALWCATFAIHRAFNAPYYAIAALPAVIAATGVVVVSASASRPGWGLAIVSLLLAANLTTLPLFYANRLHPYEPWRQACRELTQRGIQTVTVYADFMEVLLRRYGPTLDVRRLPMHCNNWQMQPIKASSAMIISHDHGQGACYKTRFNEIHGQPTEEIDLYHIQILIARSRQDTHLP